MSKFHREGDCWLWHSGKNRGGYGIMSALGQSKSSLAHRVSYEHFMGEIKPGMQLDHLCRNRSCVSPFHLEQVTNWENTKRGVGPFAENARKSICSHGHALTKENTLLNSRGHRRCRTCRDLANDARSDYGRDDRPLKSHCKNGHGFTPDNTTMRGIGRSRICRTCARDRIEKHKSKKLQESVKSR